MLDVEKGTIVCSHVSKEARSPSRIDGQEVLRITSIRNFLRPHGRTNRLTVIRGGDEIEVVLKARDLLP